MKVEKFEDMVSSLVKPGVEIVAEMKSKEAHLIHMAMGIAGEVGEVVEACIDGSNMALIIEEVGDVEFYLEGLCQSLNITAERTVHSYSPTLNFMSLLELAVRGAAVLDIVKKICMYNDTSEAKWEALHTEVQLFRLRLDAVYSALPFTHNDALEANFNKLSKRYEGLSYNDNSARNRADKD